MTEFPALQGNQLAILQQQLRPQDTRRLVLLDPRLALQAAATTQVLPPATGAVTMSYRRNGWRYCGKLAGGGGGAT
jgi:hypothetical protein